MTASNFVFDCQFCSVISKASGEDPIGSAKATDTWIIVELPLPWKKEGLILDSPLSPAFQAIRAGNTKLIAIAIAPDRQYSIPGYTRVFHYQRPSQSFAQFDKQEFLVPACDLEVLIAALLQQTILLNDFEKYRQPTQNIREILVCTHGNIDVACARFGTPIYEKLRKEFATLENLRVWRCSHFGGHQFAPTLIDLPTGQVWGHLEAQILPALIWRNFPVTELRPFYRGWAGLTKFEQIVERELWMQYGWNWLKYLKSGQVLAQDTVNEPWNADWAEVRLEFTAPDGSAAEVYQARVEVCGSVMSATNSGEDAIAVKQYRLV
ncbi:sucrase ferredoxin [Chroogloeocystis siderophila]|uniref:Sucrase ferredoxin n=1 Tax=Chroogloeocystis siderophila 5.2 s.c.1 TaxID=247279 RepID=A0A1U7HWN5_9CHRO|nr:sucrase ferredoxin [Chroogloeocystis siderophila]OKH27972.1 sucrase ferredoxin [Chroogloeocystis siderophila 5.2 s.c.1]